MKIVSYLLHEVGCGYTGAKAFRLVHTVCIPCIHYCAIHTQVTLILSATTNVALQ